MENKISVNIPLEMGYLVDDEGHYCGWSNDFPGVVVQGDSLDEIVKEFAISVQIISKYLYDENDSKVGKGI